MQKKFCFDFQTWILALLPFGAVLLIGLSALSFVPVPWPDDSAFYFVARELFRWPPRWVMLPQAPFVPSYAEFNFNTMPIYPILIGLGRWIGIDGPALLKIWPLSAWAFSGALLGVTLYRKGLPFLVCLVLLVAFSFDPELRWASVLVRPESLIGVFGMLLVFGITFGFPRRLAPSRFWDPIAALLALGAYTHFNSVHLVLPVLLGFGLPGIDVRRLVQIGLKTVLYLSPWIFTVVYHWDLFQSQMEIQFLRLSVRNDWLDSPLKALQSFFQDMGSPVPWHPSLIWVAGGLWLIVLLSFAWVGWRGIQLTLQLKRGRSAGTVHTLAPVSGWVIGAVWLWHTKAEVWFVYYIHGAIWTWVGIAALALWKQKKSIQLILLPPLVAMVLTIALAFGGVNLLQWSQMSGSPSWRWSTYQEFIDCIDQKLQEIEKTAKHPLTVWDPTFPDITIELSRRHPDWTYSRTNDFWYWTRPLWMQHSMDVDVVVIPETVNPAERWITGPASQFPDVQSIWMNWDGYYLIELTRIPGWKPNRFICQRGRWAAFIYH